MDARVFKFDEKKERKSLTPEVIMELTFEAPSTYKTHSVIYS